MASVMNLHLKYRLWIAEMNADINVLRILNDYLHWFKSQPNSKNIENEIDTYEEHLLNLRKELDALRHEMHITKMKLAVLSKDKQAGMHDVKDIIKHKACKEHYKVFRKKFAVIKKDFKKLELEEQHN